MSDIHHNIKSKVEAKLKTSPLDEDAKDEVRSGVNETITEAVEQEKRGIKVDWPSILSQILALVESFIASSANTVPANTVPTKGKE